MNNHRHDLKNAEKFLLEATTKKITENEPDKLYDDLINKDISALAKGEGKCKDKRENILNILRNLESVFTGVYFHYGNVSKSESELESKSKFEENIAEKTKLRKQKSAEQPHEQSDTTVMSYLKSEESPEEKAKTLICKSLVDII